MMSIALKDADPKLAAELQTEAVYGCPELHRDRDQEGSAGCKSRMLCHLHHPGVGASC